MTKRQVSVKVVAEEGPGKPGNQAVDPEQLKVVDFPRSATLRQNEKLVAKYQATKDSRVLEEILERNQGLLHSVLRQFSYFPDPYEDLLQVANLGLIKAVQRYDESKKAGFSSYAVAIVDGEIRHYLRDNVLMRRPRWLKQAEQRIEEASLELTKKLKRRPTLAELSEKANIAEDGILEIMKARAASSLHTADDPVLRDDISSKPESHAVQSLRYETFSLPIEDRIALHEAFNSLSDFRRWVCHNARYRGSPPRLSAGLKESSTRRSSRAPFRTKVVQLSAD
jgi:RNA polymerase sigma-B factor